VSSLTDVLGAAWLGVLQGLTEFLPVSSSGHLVLFQQWIEVSGDEVLFDLALHVGTLVPAVWFYRADVAGMFRDVFAGEGPFWQRPGVRLATAILIATVPTGLIGLGLKDAFEQLFSTPAAVAVAFAVTGVLLASTKGRDGGQGSLDALGWQNALILGVAQGFAITPGISRSGTTIAVALLLGIRRDLAVKFSFLMSVPAICGAVLVKLRDAGDAPLDPIQAGVGTLTAMISGYLALVLLVRLVDEGRFAAFRWYVWAMAVVAAGLAFLG